MTKEEKYKKMFLSLIGKQAKSMSFQQVHYCVYYIHYTFKEVPSQYLHSFVQLIDEYNKRKPLKVIKVKSIKRHLEEVEEWYAQEQIRIKKSVPAM